MVFPSASPSEAKPLRKCHILPTHISQLSAWRLFPHEGAHARKEEGGVLEFQAVEFDAGHHEKDMDELRGLT